MNTPLLKADGLVKRYGGVVAIDNVSLELNRGDVMGIIGPNGAGKSTLIGLLGGALPATEGSIHFAGEDITKLPPPDRARKGIGRTYQIPKPFLDMTVRENLLAARYSLHPWGSSKEAIAACDAILERTGLSDATHLYCRDLPLLRRKRLEVARALALEPKVLLLDEVGAGLIDSEITELIDLVKSLKDDIEGIIIIEHVLRVVRECCNRSMVINFGKKFIEGSTAEVFASDEVAAVYLGTGKNKEKKEKAADEKTHTTDLKAIEGLVAEYEDDKSNKKPENKSVLEFCGVHAGYGQARVLRGINFNVERGQVVAILGTNGAGKTTLSQVVSGLIQPTSGMVLVDGIDVTNLPPHKLSRLGVSQCMEGRRIFPSLTVEENLLLPVRGTKKQEIQERLQHVYALFPILKERRNHGGASMSGGQQQMLAIGRALMSRPRLVLFDEISLGLAPIAMDRLYHALGELKSAGLTMLIVEQDVERALELADQVYVMENGKFSLSGDAKTIRDDPALRKLYIGAEGE